MRKTLLPVLILSILLLVACKKNKDNKSQYPSIYLHDCINNINSYNGVRLCFDKVITDQRCPEDVVCFWGGYAIAQFTFTRAGNDHVLTLWNRRDTVVDGYKIIFTDLFPRPRVHGPVPPASEIRVEVEVTKL